MVELDLFKGNLARVKRGDEIVIGNATTDAGGIGAIKGIIDDHDFLDAVDPVNNVADLFANIVAFAVIMIAINRDHDFRFDLAEPVNNALNAKVGRGRGPCCPDCSRRQHRNNGFDHIGHIAANAVALDDALGAQCLREFRYGNIQVAP